MWASYRGFTEIVKVLAEAKADPNITDKVKLHYTHYCIIQIRSGSCISLQDGNTALILAARLGYTDVVKILVEHGSDLDIKNKVSVWQAVVLFNHEGKLDYKSQFTRFNY